MNPPLNGFSTLLKSLWTWRPTAQRNERRKRKLLLGVEALEDRTLLTAYIVDTFDDTIASDGFISLREAIDAARTNTAVGDAPAGTVAQDTITFTAGLSGGTISLGGTQLSVGGDLLIAGLGANQLTIDAQTNSRVFGIIDSNTEISGLKLINGSTSGRGGAISSLRSELRLRNVEITASESTSDDGGAIYSRFGTLIVSSSTIWGNRAERAGAAITNDGGQLTILNSTLSKNESKLDGGALALYNFSATTIINSTITGNRADSDGNSTGAGGAILLVGGSDLELYNTISAGNFAGAGSVPNEFNVGGTIVASSNNLIGAASSSGGLTDGTDGNIVGINGTGTWDINAILDTNLMDNGGPTPTHLLVPGSPALNTGDNRHATEDGQISGMFLPADQRGESRFVGTVDMGAVEVQLPEVLVVSTLLDESDGDYSDGDLSLREAIEIANGRMGAESIAFRSDMVGTIALGGTQIQISDDVTITGPGADKLVIDAQADSRIFSVTGGIVELRGMKLSNGRVVGRGGAITSFNSNLTLRELEFTGSESTIDDGGAVYIRFGTAVVSNSTFSSNRAHRAGAALTNEGASLTIINSTFSGNESRLDGGALALYNFSTTTLINSTLTGNRADSDGNSTGAGGGLLLVTGSQLRLYNTIVAGNFMGTGNVAHDLNIQGTLVDSHHNLIGDADSAGGLTDGTDGNIVGVGGSGVRDINTILDTDLAANGGRTPTHLLVPGSPAFNAGDNTRATENGQVTGKPLTVDQRGGSRIRDLTVDIGAIEFSLPPETLTVSTLLDESDGDFSDGDLSLREAIEIANDRPGAEQITFRGDITGRILLGGTQLEVLDDVTIVGSGADILAIDGGGLSRIFNLA
ncbi:MAG: hypothetical protein KDA69_12740, partial [Planctomycetaceae bacterium]|nr:hypothetical protein [Planctomycetaceae bacterium]